MWLFRLLRDLNDLRANRKMGLIAAGVAFFGMFSLFPGLAALIALFGLVADPAVVLEEVDLWAELIPGDVFAILRGQLEGLLSARSDTLGVAGLVSIAVAFWSARSAVAALMQSLNEIFGAPDRGGLRHVLVALLLTAGLIGVAITALLMVVVAPVVLALVPLGPAATLALNVTRWAVALLVLMAALGLLFRFGPNRRGQRLGWVTPGAVMTVVVWLGASYGFSLYLANFGTYNEVYGSIGAVAALLMWFYISAYLILLGAGLNAVLAKRSESTAGTKSGDNVAESGENVTKM